MKRTVLSLLVLSLALAPAAAFAAKANDTVNVNPTFYKDVLPVLQENCQVCHRPNGANLGGMVAPMAFTSYQDTRPWAKSIAKRVEAREMPPWHASPEFADVFVNERTLTDDQIATLVRWSQTGAPAGDIADAPAVKEWPESNGWTIGEPDLVLNFGPKYFVEDDVEDLYIGFTTEITEEMLPEPRWMKAVEFRPGTPVVHHIIAAPLGGIAPGNQATVHNDGFATLLKPGTTIRWQMHYHKEPGEGTGVWDQSSAAIRFYPEGYEPDYRVLSDPLAKMDFEIPAGDPNYSATVTTTFERDTLVLGYLPHMHLRGKSAHYVAKYPDGTEEVLLDVPNYDFNWQTLYEYPAEGKLMPAGTQIELTMAWDNSADNPSNPDPTETVRFGRPTTSEMMFGFVSYVDAEKGYVPPEGAGFFGGGQRRQIDPERLKAIIKDRFGLDWDSMTEEEQQELMQRFRGGRNRGTGNSSGQ